MEVILARLEEQPPILEFSYRLNAETSRLESRWIRFIARAMLSFVAVITLYSQKIGLGENCMKWLLSKLTIRTIPLFSLIVLLFIYARPQAMLMLGGIPLILVGEAIRLWAAGHLSKNKEVTNTGPYAYVKNPLYIGTFFVMIGFCVISARWELLLLGLVLFFFSYAPRKKKVEADRLRKIFGEAWDDYDQSVPDYLPKRTPYKNRGSHRWEWIRVVANSEHQTATSALTGIILMGVRFFL